MGQPISLFSGYNQGENRTTNYCLLLLKMFYEENPKFLGEVLSDLVSEDVGDRIGVKFRQQEKGTSSIPDGLIVQEPLTIYMETKHFDWFYDAQLENHLESLNERAGTKVLIALGNFESTDENRFEHVEKLCKDKYSGMVYFAPVTFEDFVGAVSEVKHLPKNLADAVDDFRTYLDETSLLPAWPHFLDAVNCAGWPEQVRDHSIYMCPTTGGAYSHRRCKYFGMYRNKRVEVVALIEAVVDLLSPDEHSLKWENVGRPEKELVAEARQRHAGWRPGQYPARVFVLGTLHETDFCKDSPGGMWGPKQYFNVEKLAPEDAKDLAEKLHGKVWSDLELSR